MKKLLFILFLFLFGYTCNQVSQESFEVRIDTIITVDTTHYCHQDSVLRLADEAMRDLDIKDDLRKNMIFQIQQQLQNEKLTKSQIQVLQQQSQSYEIQIQEYHRKRVVRKDSVIYNIIYKDTVICRPVYISDTIYVEVLDTVKVKKLKRKRKHYD